MDHEDQIVTLRAENQRLREQLNEAASAARERTLQDTCSRLEQEGRDARKRLACATEQYEWLLTEARALRHDLAMVRTPTPGVWLWQGDGADFPESLACPVVMSAETLRALLGTARWGVWCVEDKGWCMQGTREEAERALPEWASGRGADVDPDHFHYEIRMVPGTEAKAPPTVDAALADRLADAVDALVQAIERECSPADMQSPGLAPARAARTVLQSYRAVRRRAPGST